MQFQEQLGSISVKAAAKSDSSSENELSLWVLEQFCDWGEPQDELPALQKTPVASTKYWEGKTHPGV